MAEIGATLNNIGNGLKSSLGTASVYLMWTFIILMFFVIVGVIMWFYYNKKSYNIHVVILRARAGGKAFNFEAGKVGKQFFDKKRKEVRFKIYQAKKFGIQYNEEAVDQKYFIDRMVDGKHTRMVFMAPNDEGWLQPTMLDFDMSKGLKATVDNADLSYYNTELELMDSLFNNKSFLEKYYLLILVILMIIVVLIQWYAAAQIHKGSVNNLEAVKLLTQTAQSIASSSGQASQVIPVG
jgi:hypothetical protein